MAYLYHAIPEDFKGKYLYPLNELKSKYPKSYNQQAKKYSYRKYLMKYRLPILNCLWNDVIHLSPVHPRKVKKALKETGNTLGKIKYFKINPKILDPNKTIIWLYKSPGNKKDYMDTKNFVIFNPKLISKLNDIPNKTIKYYKQCAKENKKPLRFLFVPHIFYKDKIDISKVDIIEV